MWGGQCVPHKASNLITRDEEELECRLWVSELSATKLEFPLMPWTAVDGHTAEGASPPTHLSALSTVTAGDSEGVDRGL